MIMKKIMLALLVVFGMLITNSSQAQTKVKYYYYPQQNVYYNTTSHQYAYSSDVDTWTWVEKLPATTTVTDKDYYVVLYSPNDEIWKQNSVHKMKYKDGQLKKVKTKKEDN
ncbi:MAG: hypothetical protein C4330_05070 [Chitinophagaceae bacterium]